MEEIIIHDEHAENIQTLQEEVASLKMQIEDIIYMLHKKIGGGTADIKGTVAQPSSVPAGTIPAGTITKTQVSYEEVTVNVAIGQTTGTGTATSGSVIIGYRPSGNVDQTIKSIAISGTTVTVTLSAGATAQNNFDVILLKA